MYTYDNICESKQLKYDTAQSIIENTVRYTFISKGERHVLKVIHYSLLEELNGRQLFNFGFGDYNFENGAAVDHVISNNGDPYRVFNTVLSTVPRFFEIHNNAIVMVKGSDSGCEFANKCRITCRKNCAEICRNANRRINIYSGYVNKHYDALKMDYTFYGQLNRTDNEFSMMDYEPGNKQTSIYLIKNKKHHYMKSEENQSQLLMEPATPEEMMALYLERTKDSDVDPFAESNAAARLYIKGLVLPDHLKLTKD